MVYIIFSRFSLLTITLREMMNFVLQKNLNYFISKLRAVKFVLVLGYAE